MGARPGRPGPTDPDEGVYQGSTVARRFTSPDGMVVLVGKTARDNDLLSVRLASPRDFWFHVAGESGSHVVVRNPENLDRLPRATRDYAAGLAAGYSRARAGGTVAVHMARCSEVTKGRGMPPGMVLLGRHETVRIRPRRE